MIYPKFPTKYIAFSQYFSNRHQAVDIANAVTVGSKKYDNKDVFMAHEGKIITNSYASDYGYFVEYEYYDGNDRYVFADGHFDKASELKIGETYPQGTFINRMGSSGTSAGVHDHHRITKNGVRVNPLDYEYVYPDQVVGTLEDAQLKHYTPEVKPVIPSVEPNVPEDNMDTSNNNDVAIEDDVVEYIYKQGDTFGQVIINLGLATKHGLWGDTGDVNYYNAQLHEQGIYGNIPVGTTIKLRKRTD